MSRLIVNADDFGLTGGVNAGVIRAYQNGIVTSATIMANGAAFREAAALSRENPPLGIGIHLVAVGGMPLAPPSEIPSLVDERGKLPATLTTLATKLMRGAIRSEDIEREFRAQVQKVVDAGITPTHLDTHKHSHTQPLVAEALARVALDFGIRKIRNPFESFSSGRVSGPQARRRRGVHLKQRLLSTAVSAQRKAFKRIISRYGLRAPDQLYGVALTGLLDAAALCKIIDSIQGGTTELMCHPALYDVDLEKTATRLKRERERELEALTDESVRRTIEEKRLELITYREL